MITQKIKVKHITANWIAEVKRKFKGYAYGLCGRSKNKIVLYKLKNILGVWSEHELKEIKEVLK